MKDEEQIDKDYKQMLDLFISAVKVVDPSISDKRAERVVLNVGAWLIKQRIKAQD